MRGLVTNGLIGLSFSVHVFEMETVLELCWKVGSNNKCLAHKTSAPWKNQCYYCGCELFLRRVGLLDKWLWLGLTFFHTVLLFCLLDKNLHQCCHLDVGLPHFQNSGKLTCSFIKCIVPSVGKYYRKIRCISLRVNVMSGKIRKAEMVSYGFFQRSSSQ